MKDAYQYKDLSIGADMPLSFKDIDGRKGIVTGYFAHFGSVDSDNDIIKKGAFLKSIAESGPASMKPRIKHIMNHDWTQPLGVLTVLQEDSKGLYYESQLGSHALGEDFIKMVDSGLITEHSIGFRTIKFNQLKPWDQVKDGDAARELTELKLYEGSSLTFWGANPNTPLLGLKGEIDVDKVGKRIDILVKALRDGKLTDETCSLLEIELKQLHQAFIDLNKKPVVQTTSEPVVTTQTKQKRDFSFIKSLI